MQACANKVFIVSYEKYGTLSIYHLQILHAEVPLRIEPVHTYKECRFYHLLGTKNIPNPKSYNQFSKKPAKKSHQQQTQFKPKQNDEKLVSKNRFAALEEEVEEEITEVKQVFHKGQTKITDTLVIIMERLAAIEEKQDDKAVNKSRWYNDLKSNNKWKLSRRRNLRESNIYFDL